MDLSRAHNSDTDIRQKVGFTDSSALLFPLSKFSRTLSTSLAKTLSKSFIGKKAGYGKMNSKP